jgi:hypothetical protein
MEQSHSCTLSELAAMLASNVPAIATRATDLGNWGVSGHLADLIPYLAYGFTVAYTFEWLK